METDAAVDKIINFQFLSTAAWKSLLAFHTVPTGPAAVNQQTTNRTDHLLQKPDIFTCYRQKLALSYDLSLTEGNLRDFTQELSSNCIGEVLNEKLSFGAEVLCMVLDGRWNFDRLGLWKRPGDYPASRLRRFISYHRFL